MEDQILRVDKEQEVISDADLARKLLKKEQRLLTRLQEAQEDEARVLDRFLRIQARLQRRSARLERIKSNLLLVRMQIAELQIADQQPAHMEPELVIPATQESTLKADSEEIAPVQVEQDTMVAQESEGSSPSQTEFDTPTIIEPELRAPESELVATPDSATTATPTSTEPEAIPLSEIEATTSTLPELEPIAISDSTIDAIPTTTASQQEADQESEGSSSSYIESTTPTTIEQEPVASADSTAVEPEIDATPEVDTTSGSIMERVPTKPLQLEQENQPVARSLSTDIQSAKEAWVAAESALQNARNAAHGIAASISFLSHTGGLSNEFMEELVRKQADANKALLKAQDAARVAYERFVQAQKDAEQVASQVSMNTSDGHSQQMQENGALPPFEDNGSDQTARLHAIRLYKE